MSWPCLHLSPLDRQDGLRCPDCRGACMTAAVSRPSRTPAVLALLLVVVLYVVLVVSGR